jgi:heptosyltransferase-1
MSNILLIKSSSLGDVIHQMPAITEARLRLPGDTRLTWVVEEPFVPLAALHPGVDVVVAVASRRWRYLMHRPQTWREIARFVQTLRGVRYDTVVDTQGLFRTALIARFARGVRHGYDSKSARESWAAKLYDVRHGVDRSLHAVARNRILTGLALGYASDGAIDFGLDRSALAPPAAATRTAVLLHGTARAEKEWPQRQWTALAAALAASGYDVVLPWGTADERARAERIAAGTAARVPERHPLDAVAKMLAGAALVVGVDTGLLHLAAALGVPLVAIFIGSDPRLTGPVGSGPMMVVGGKGEMPSVEDTMVAIDRVT